MLATSRYLVAWELSHVFTTGTARLVQLELINIISFADSLCEYPQGDCSGHPRS